MRLSPALRWTLRVISWLVLLILYIPLAIVIMNSFNKSRTFAFPPTGVTLKWWNAAAHSSGALDALWTSVKAGLGATAVALVLGTMAAFAVQRYRFFGRNTVSFLVILPIALPGIVTGMALNAFFVAGHITVSMWTIVIGHATFCVVIVYNNALARLRRSSPSLIEASMDLGADGWQTFRFVVWPVLSTALIAGGLLAFALSFDEVVVTFFTAGAQTTLPLLILGYIRLGQQLPVVNVIAMAMILLTVIPVAVAQRLMRDTGVLRRSAGNVTEAVESAQVTAV
jgi:putative spermidine/putrescine transport system permease protein